MNYHESAIYRVYQYAYERLPYEVKNEIYCVFQEGYGTETQEELFQKAKEILDRHYTLDKDDYMPF